VTASSVMAVHGPVAAGELGRTLVHEHVLIASNGSQLDPTRRFDRADIIARGVDAFAALHEHGVATVVDPCPIELGRDPEILAEVSARSGINLVCATGFYIEGGSLGIPEYWRHRHPEEICELYLCELHDGIGATGIRPGVIKAASSAPVGRHEQKAISAAGLAAAASGVAVITHTNASAHGDEQQDLLAGHGADLGRCLIGHQDAQTVGGLVELARRGSFVGVDRVGYESIATDDHRADLVAGMFHAGLGERICVSQDRMCTQWAPRPQFWVPKGKEAFVAETVLPRIQAEAIDRGLAYVFTDFVPRLLERGLTAADVDTIFVANPRRLLTGEA
jgi:phosphotriesterase-related protein